MLRNNLNSSSSTTLPRGRWLPWLAGTFALLVSSCVVLLVLLSSSGADKELSGKENHSTKKDAVPAVSLSSSDMKKLSFIRKDLSPEAMKKIATLSPQEILAKYSGYLNFSKTCDVDEAEIAQVRKRILSKKRVIKERGTIPTEYRTPKQTVHGLCHAFIDYVRMLSGKSTEGKSVPRMFALKTARFFICG